MKRTLSAAAVAVAAFAGSANAAVVWNFVEGAGSFTGTFSGSLDMTGAVLKFSPAAFAGFFTPSRALVDNRGSGSGQASIYAVSGPADFGPGTSFFFATSQSGDAFQVNGSDGNLGVPVGYVSGSALAGTVTFDGSYASR